jgi:hypothetical protein
VIKLPEKSKQEKAASHKQDKIGEAANNPTVKCLMNTKTPDYKAVETMLDSGRKERPASAPSNYSMSVPCKYKANQVISHDTVTRFDRFTENLFKLRTVRTEVKKIALCLLVATM